MKNHTRYPAYIIALTAALAVGGFTVSLTQSKAAFTVFAIVYFAVLVGWLTMTFRNRS